MNNTAILADHLVGNLYYNLEAVPVIAGSLDAETMRYAVGGPAAIVYSEMCRQLREGNGLSAGSLDAGLSAVGFDRTWLSQMQRKLKVESLPTLVNYAADINNRAELLRLEKYSRDAIVAANEPDAKAPAIVGDLLSKLTANNRSVDGVEHTTTIAQRVRMNLEKVRNGGIWGASTGFSSLDYMFRLIDGELIVIAGRPSQGKTSLSRQIFYNRAMQIAQTGENGQVIFFSSDDTSDAFVMNLACTLAKVDSRRFRVPEGDSRHATPAQWAELEHQLTVIESLPLFIDDTPQPTVEYMYYKCAMLNAQKPVRLAGQDYASLVKTPNARSERQEAELAFTGMKGIGSTLGFPWVALSQLTKAVETRADKFPTPSDLLYAGEAEGNVVLTIVRPEHYVKRGEDIQCDEVYKKDTALINVGKNKSGDIGIVPMYFKAEWARFDKWGIKVTDLNEY